MTIAKYEYEEENGDNRVDISGTYKHLYLSLDNDWYGDSDSGFGATLNLTMPPEEAKRLADWINHWLVELEIFKRTTP